ncbi:MAG: HDOD domain-containing protein [Nitrospirae bacterium]|nr:HDOD domain-containing protein [Nitrospirota bacterium]
MSIDEMIAKTCDLPPMPGVAQRVMQMVLEENTTPELLQKVIAADPGLTARILKIANSPFYGIPRAVRTLSTAIMILGFRSLRNLVVAVSSKTLYKRHGLTEQMLWEHSVGTALAAYAIAKEIRFPDPEEAFLAGLFHDIGKVILNNEAPDRYATVIEQVYNDGVTAYFAEKALFGYSHPEVGALVVKKWRLSEELEYSIRYHHDFRFLLTGYPYYLGKLAAVIHLADLVTIQLGIGRREASPNLQPADTEAAEVLKINEGRLTILTERIHQSYLEEKETFA